MTQTIYILTEGDYSDYHIIGAYSSKELAEKAQFLYRDSQIEEYSLDSIPDAPPGMKAWSVYVCDEEGISCYSMDPDYEIPYENYFTTRDGFLTASYHVWATDEDHARKIAQDQWYQYKAQLAGIL
jgi:hypothetical protein